MQVVGICRVGCKQVICKGRRECYLGKGHGTLEMAQAFQDR